MTTDTAVVRITEADALKALDKELERRRDVIESSAASMIDPDRMRGVVLSAFTRNAELWECDPITVVRSVVEAAQSGLEPTGAIGGAHLVPRWNSKRRVKEAQLIIDYRGLATLARRSGEIARITARAVREADEFAYQQGTEEWIRHVPALSGDPGPYVYFYAIAHFRAGGVPQFVVMSAAQIEAHKQRFAPRNRQGEIVGPWVSDFEEMAKKTVLRNLAKLLPLTIEARTLIDFEDRQVDETSVVPPKPDQSARLRKALHDRLQGDDIGVDPEQAAVDAIPEGQEPLFDPVESARIDAEAAAAS
jgi:recombination protein RecT